MHRFPSSSTILRVRIASLLVCARCTLVPLTMGGLAYGLILQDKRVATWALILLPIALVATLLQIIVAARTNCPLCLTPILGEKSCNKHKKAFRLCGSYKLPVALSALFRNNLRCPYCNEPSVLKVRPRH